MDQKYYLSLDRNLKPEDQNRVAGIGLDVVFCSFLPRIGDSLSFSVNDLSEMTPYKERGWKSGEKSCEDTLRCFAGTYTVKRVVHKVIRRENRLETDVSVEAIKEGK